MTTETITAISITTILFFVGVVFLFAGGRKLVHLRNKLSHLYSQLEEQGKHSENRDRSLQDSIGQMERQVHADVVEIKHTGERQLQDHQAKLRLALGEHKTHFERRHGEALKSIQETLDNGYRTLQQQIVHALDRSTQELTARFDGLTNATDKKLLEISGQVEKRLDDGFEKTTATFADILKRLALIDEAQKRISELSTNVVSLQEILSDKRSRGAFGEVQLNALVRNVIPPSNYRLQYTFPNGRIVDCALFLPSPTGTVAIDSKFPKESFDRMLDLESSQIERTAAKRQFKVDVKKHIQDIAMKYIVPGETSDGAIMFLPAEAIFAEIHAHHTDLVEEAHAARVWLVSPTTLMAILTTVLAVIKDEEREKNSDILRKHLSLLSKDFGRFGDRMDALSKHIRQANDDVEKVQTSARKISAHFQKIERVDLDTPPPSLGHSSSDQESN